MPIYDPKTETPAELKTAIAAPGARKAGHAGAQSGTIEHLIEMARQELPSTQDAPGSVAPRTLAGEAAPTRAAASAISEKTARPGLWGGLLQLKVLLPYVSRLLPLLDAGLARGLATLPPERPPLDIRPFEQGVAEVQRSHRELRSQLASQGLLLRQVDDQVGMVRGAAERNTARLDELAEDLDSLRRLVRWSAGIALGLLFLLVSLVGYLIFVRR